MYKKTGFTLVELLVVIAIIGVLSSTVVTSLKGAAKKARGVSAVQNVKQVKQAVQFYILDTGNLPPACRLNCVEATDPMLTRPSGITGWSGPYLRDGLWNRKHPWGGHMGIFQYDSDSNGKLEAWIIMDDDAPGTNASDNTGLIPSESLQYIDEVVDDGDLEGGYFFLGDNSPFAEGEGAWRVQDI